MSQPGQRCVRVVVSKRDKEYAEKMFDKTARREISKTGKGWEISRETMSCDEHAKNFEVAQ
jgi:hypothetical protein